jgi:hypothetical protein
MLWLACAPIITPDQKIGSFMGDSRIEPFTQPVAQHYSGADPSYHAPPKLHWALVLLFTIFTLGIFMLVWIFIQSSWVKKIDPTSNATKLFIAYLVMIFGGQILTGVAGDGIQLLIGLLLVLASYIVFYIGVYSIRRSMLDHYNSVEPMSLKLSRVMLFFFNCIYLQYHMRRIARWKAGGA